MSNTIKAQVMVRGWVTPLETAEPAQTFSGKVAGPSPWSLVLDDETTIDLGQKLRVVGYQVHKGSKVTEQGFAASTHLTAAEREVLRSYCAARGLQLLTREKFIDLFYRIGFDRRGTIIGYNLPFDLSRLAIRHGASKPRHRQRKMRGGFTLTLSKWATRPPIRIKRVSSRAAFIQFTAPVGRHPEHRRRARRAKAFTFRGYFCDVATLAGALLGEKRGLGPLAEVLGVATKQTIDEATLGGPLTDELLDYAMRDVQVTWACYTALLEQYATLGLDTPPHWLYSEASIAKAHLTQIGVKGWQHVQPDAPDWLIGTAMEAYYGGRTETHIRRLLTPGVLTDVVSEYPTVSVLMGLSPWLLAQGVDWVEQDPADVEAWLGAFTVQQLLDPNTWPYLTRLVLLQPGPEDQLPTRADFAGDGVFNVAQAHRTDGGPEQWYTLADAAASFLETGHVPMVLKCLVFTRRDLQPNLKPILIAGKYPFDPYADDLVASLVELRQELKDSVDPALRAAAPAIKATVNSVCYGIPIEVNTVPEPGGVDVVVHRPDGSTYPAHVPRSETPGQYFHPLIASWVAGGGRLLLALIIRMVRDAGGTYAFCDTDSLFIAATREGLPVAAPTFGAELPLLTWAKVSEIVDRLRTLNPYGGPLAGKSILKIEPDNYDPLTGEQRQIYAWCIASKRYALITLTDDGEPVIVCDQGNRRRSEHGLGHLLPPYDGRDGATRFHDDWWDHVLHQALDLSHEDPEWFSQPAVGRLTVTNTRDDRAFINYNERRRYDDHIRPWTFAITTTPTPVDRARTGARILVAPFSKDPRKRMRSVWTDRDHPEVTYRIRVGDDSYIIDGAVTVTNLKDYFATYCVHPEAKSGGPDGEQCAEQTIGILRPLTVEAAPVLGRIGKETNRVTADTDLADADGLPLVYTEKTCRGCGEPVRPRQRWCSDACRKRSRRRREAVTRGEPPR